MYIITFINFWSIELVCKLLIRISSYRAANLDILSYCTPHLFYYFNSANFLTNFIWRRLSMFKYDIYVTNSLIITKYINKHINMKINVYFWQPGFEKGDNWNANRTHTFIFSWSAIIGPKLFFTRYNNRQSSEQNNRKLISLHNNGEDEKHAHGFADF